MTSIMNNSSDNIFNDAPLATIMTLDLTTLTNEELLQYVAKTRELQASPQTLKSKIERESVKLGARKERINKVLDDLLLDDDDE
jgi:hypothetical protein